MFPIFHTLVFTASSAQLWAFAAVAVMALYVVWDGYQTHGRKRLLATLLSASALGVVGAWAVYAFVTPEHLPPGEFGLPLRSYGLMAVIGMVTCFFIERHFGRAVGLSGDQILTVWVYGGLASVVGARGLHVLVNWGDYAEAPITALRFWDGGLAFIGAALVSLLFAVAYLRYLKVPVLASLDALTLGLALTHGFGRLGCFMAGCCYGRPTDLPWGVSFPVGSIAQYTLAQMGVIAPDAVTPHLHPTQLYESFATFIIGGLLLLWYVKRRPRSGMILTTYLLSYPVVRFFLELVRDDPEREFLFRFPEEAPRLLSTTQAVGLLMIPFAVAALLWLRRHPESQAATRSASACTGRIS